MIKLDSHFSARQASPAVDAEATRSVAYQRVSADVLAFKAERDVSGRRDGQVSIRPTYAADRGSVDANTLPILASVAEFVVIALSTFEAGGIYHHFTVGYLPDPAFYVAATLALAALFVTPCALGRDYSVKRLLERKEQVRSVLRHWNSAYALFVFALFIVHATDFYSRGFILAQYVVGLTAALISRLIMTRLVANGLARGTMSGKTVIVIGDPHLAQTLAQRLRNESKGAKIVGVISLAPLPPYHALRAEARNERQFAQEAVTALQAVQNLSADIELDDIVIALPWSEATRIRTLVASLAVIPATIHLAPDFQWDWARNPVVVHVGQLPTIRLLRAPLTLKDRILKRVFDVAATAVLLVVTAPLFALIALAIKLNSPGPVIFRQRRNGFNQREFRVFKFRTMTALDDGPVIRQATRNDKRITSVGKFLRATNLDELPQFINVLFGQMSLVGPRPHAVAHNNEYEERIRLYARRHNVKPGITGWAQVNGLRGETNSIEKMQRRVQHDLFYIDHWSLMLDVKILIMTPFSMRAYRNAY